MNTKYKMNWEETKEKWKNYWIQQNTGRPLMCVIARKKEIEEEALQENCTDICRSEGKYHCLPDELKCKNPEDKYLNPDKIVARYRYFCETHKFLGESFPNMQVDFGPGSVAAYLGSDIDFRMDTIWYNPCIEELTEFKQINFDPNNSWLTRHLEYTKRCKELSKDDFLVCIPDLMEGMDVLATMRGAQELVFDGIDEPEEVKKRVWEIQKQYFEFYDRFYEIVKDEEGGCAYMVFQIWGPGKTAKLQCDFGALMSPSQFKDFIVEPLRMQAKGLDQAVYHLDGPDNIKHLDDILSIEEINAIQWTSGDAGPDGTLEKWDVIYDKSLLAGKSIWVKVYSGEFEDWIKNAERLVKKYGSHSLFLHFPEMSEEQAEYLMSYAERNWSNIEGTFCRENKINKNRNIQNANMSF